MFSSKHKTCSSVLLVQNVAYDVSNNYSARWRTSRSWRTKLSPHSEHIILRPWQTDWWRSMSFRGMIAEHLFGHGHSSYWHSLLACVCSQEHNARDVTRLARRVLPPGELHVSLVFSSCYISLFVFIYCLTIRISNKPMQLGSPSWHENVPRCVLKMHLLWVNRSKVKVTSHTNSAGVGFCTLMSAGSF